jgi:hypothetical protein
VVFALHTGPVHQRPRCVPHYTQLVAEAEKVTLSAHLRGCSHATTHTPLSYLR